MPKRRLILVWAAGLIALMSLIATQAIGQSVDFERCLTMNDSAARARCLENWAARAAPQPGSRDVGGWRLVRTKDPRGGPDAVSIMKTADPLSDPDIAGLTVRCAENGPEALIIVVDPLPPKTKPHVRLGLRGKEKDFEATVVPPFSSLLLPPQAMALIASLGPEDLFFKLDAERTAIQGAVNLAGLNQALAQLQANCPRP